MSAQKKPFPSKEELMDALKRLQEISIKNEQLTRDLAKGKEVPEEKRKEIESCINEQSRIVNYFLELSEDEEEKKKYSVFIKKIEDLIQKLDKAEKMEELEKLKGEIGEAIQNWVDSLEKIVVGVLAQAEK